jgi:8-hydroxy-5-deazaflavin:NADPH oxidoreductase
VDERVAIIGGTGALGYGLALRLGRAGVAVTIGSRDAARANDAARRATAAVDDGAFDGLQNTEAARAAEIIVLAVPFASQAATLTSIAESLTEGQLLVDTTVPLATAVGGRPVRTVGVWQGSAAQQARELVPAGVGVVAALHTLSAAALEELDHGLDEDVLVCGDSRAEKRRLSALVERIDGLRCVDCGRLEMARYVEQLTPLIIGINIRHKARAGIRIVGLPEPG